MKLRTKLGVIFTAMTLCFSQAYADTTANASWILDYTPIIQDFPQPGIQFRSITPLLREPAAFKKAIQAFAERYRDADIDAIAGLDSRGFIFGAALAYELDLPFILVRKSGKLPGKVEKISYGLEYGKSSFEIEIDSVKPGQRILVIDDVLATGGTAEAASDLIRRLGGEVFEVACMIEISALKGRDRVTSPVFTLIAVE